jgi:hypothetical protein
MTDNRLLNNNKTATIHLGSLLYSNEKKMSCVGAAGALGNDGVNLVIVKRYSLVMHVNDKKKTANN